MLILLPNERNGLTGLLKSLTSKTEYFGSIFDVRNYHATEVNLGLPVFSIRGDMINLNKMLIAMGLKTAFSEREADFSGITGDHSLFISTVLHKARIDVSSLCCLFVHVKFACGWNGL